jgi:hypothetical protein
MNMAKSKTTTKAMAPAKKAAAKPAKPAKQPKVAKTIYRVCEATEGRQLVGEYATADEATKKGLAHVAKHGIDVEIARGKISGSEFQPEFTEVLKAGEAKAVAAEATAEAAPLPATDAAPAGAVPTAEPESKSTKRDNKGGKSKTLPAEPDAKPAKRGNKGGKAKAADKPKKMSALDAAAKVLGETGQAMSSQELIEAMSKKGYWTSPNGATPHATLYAAMLREIQAKGKEARFQKTDRGRFAAR